MGYTNWTALLALCTFAYSNVAIAEEEAETYDEAIPRYEERVGELVDNCRVLQEFKEQRGKLNDIETRMHVDTGASELCVTSPNLNASALQTLGNVLSGYTIGSVPAVGPVLDEIAGLIIKQGFDAERTQCYPIDEGQKVFGELTGKLTEIEGPYQELRRSISEEWWSIASRQDEIEQLAQSGSAEKLPERLARLREVSNRKSVCPNF